MCFNTRKGTIMRRLLQGCDFFVASLILFIVLPILPLLLEQVIDGVIKTDSIMLAAVMFPISAGISSRTITMFFLGLFATVSFGIVYGITRSDSTVMLVGLGISSLDAARLILGSFMLATALERFARHVVYKDKRLFDFII
jgi:hypothetical protein